MKRKSSKKSVRAVFMFLLAVGLFAGCSNGGTDDGGQTKEGQAKSIVSTEPVSLTMLTTMPDEQFKQIVGDHIQKKYPYITLNHVHPEGTNIAPMLQEFITAGTVPDIIYASPGDIFGLMDMQVLEDMTPLIKKHNFDLGRFNPDVLRGIKQYFPKDQLPVLPDNVQGAVLTYNKTIFDKFGVSYPKDGMTWTEAIELARKVTRNEGGVQYRGLDFAVGYLINNNQLSLSFIDSKTGRAAVSNDGWKQWFNTMRSIYEIEGNQVTKDKFDKADPFLKEQILAMYASPSGMLNRIPDAEKAGLKWDLATLPYYPDATETGMQLNTTFYFVPPTSKYKDQAFDVIAELLSDEVQSANARNGRMTILNKQEIKNEFGKDLPYLQGKNVTAIFKLKIARPAAITEDDKLVKGPLKKQFFDVISGSKDVNTALRETEEEADKAIQAKKSQ